MLGKITPSVEDPSLLPECRLLAAGSDGQVQFNKDGYLFGDPAFTWDSETRTLSVDGSVAGITNGVDGADGADGSDGVDARAVTLNAGDQSIEYDASGANPSPATTTLTAVVVNTSGVVYYEFFKNDVSLGAATTTNTYEYTAPADFDDMPDKMEVQIREDGPSGIILARDQETIFGIKPGVDARAVNLVAADQSFEYDTAGANPSPTTANVVATALNTTGTVYYDFLKNGVSVQNSTSGTYLYTAPADFADMPETVEVRIREGSDSGDILSRDKETLFGIKAGAAAYSVNLVAADQSFEYDTDGANPSPASANVVATAINISGTAYYEFFKDGASVQGPGTSDTYAYTPPADFADMPDRIDVQLREGSAIGDILATDQETLSGLKAGADAVTIIVDNESHTLPTSNVGVVTYTG